MSPVFVVLALPTDGSCYLLRARGRFVEGSYATLAACFVVRDTDIDFDEFD